MAVPAQTQLQEELPANVRGRVFGVLNTLVSIASFLPIIVVGPIADAIGTSLVVQGASVVVLLVAAGSILRAVPSAEPIRSGSLIDAVDPVAVTGRSLTQPIELRYIEAPEDAVPNVEVVATPVVPGQPGPAPVAGPEPASKSEVEPTSTRRSRTEP